ncbi:unnamed protein product [Rotaria sp. Silwood2]|nr:unnamed protein product [Rotaria sp. Silwood2]CAF3129832.1 unnamed protein product [Rotaria sp. Silwood2]CAF4449465.1 unnamed protein product [Rotaria sp. Silwood2]
MADSTIISFTTSNRGKRMLVYSGYVYRLKRPTVKVKYCVWQSNGCAASVHTNTNDDFIKANGHHRHMPAPERIELRDLKNKVKDRVQGETTSVPKIYEEELARSNLSSVALTLAPLTVEDKKTIYDCFETNSSPPGSYASSSLEIILLK